MPCGQAIEELAALVSYIVNNLNGITSRRHGGPRFPFHRNGSRRTRQEQAG